MLKYEVFHMYAERHIVEPVSHGINDGYIRLDDTGTLTRTLTRTLTGTLAWRMHNKYLNDTTDRMLIKKHHLYDKEETYNKVDEHGNGMQSRWRSDKESGQASNKDKEVSSPRLRLTMKIFPSWKITNRKGLFVKAMSISHNLRIIELV